MARRRRKALPKDPVSATITGLSHEGRGIAQVDGKTVFIHNALPDEEVSFKYTFSKSSHAEGEALEISNPSPDRVTPPCQHYGMCGGCSLQHLSHDAQIKHKQKTLLEHLQHFGNVSSQTILPPLTGPTQHYRHKARLGVRYVGKKAKVLVGFRERNGRYLADIDSCPILAEPMANLITALSELIMGLSIKEQLPQIEVAMDGNETALIIRHLEPFSDADLAAITAFAEQHCLQLYFQPGGPKTIHKHYPADGNERLTLNLPSENVTLQFYPTDFTQVNTDINQQMVARAIELLALSPEDRVLDLFCGLGNFSIPIAKRAKHVVGVEGETAMVERAQENARLNKLDNTLFYAANLAEDCLSHPWMQLSYNKVLIDPPRSGAEVLIRQLPKLNPNRIVYVSCNPATLARDAGILVNEQGYQLVSTGIMDMFPHTSHVESIALFTRAPNGKD